jgi:hypothetical protein
MTVQTKEGWEERFDNSFWEHRIPKNTKQSADIKSFICQVIKEAEQRVAREIIDEYTEYIKGLESVPWEEEADELTTEIKNRYPGTTEQLKTLFHG